MHTLRAAISPSPRWHSTHANVHIDFSQTPQDKFRSLGAEMKRLENEVRWSCSPFHKDSQACEHVLTVDPSLLSPRVAF